MTMAFTLSSILSIPVTFLGIAEIRLIQVHLSTVILLAVGFLNKHIWQWLSISD